MNYESVILLAIVGYLGMYFREIPKFVAEYLWWKFTLSIVVNTYNSGMYWNVEKYLTERYNNILCKHVFYDECYLRASDSLNMLKGIGFGRKYIYLGKLTWLIIDKYKQGEVRQVVYVKSTYVGFDKHKYFNELNECVYTDDDETQIKIYGSKYSYNYTKQPARNIETVFGEAPKIIMNFVNNWIKNEHEYKKYGFLYKTGILLYGEPGTGKTSAIRAVASSLKWNLHVLQLKDYKTPDDLISRIMKIPQKSIIALEDIDTVITNREKSEENVALLGTVLNILDGTLSPSNVIFFATTNEFEKLDKALIRDGRFDLKIELKPLNYIEACQMIEYYGLSSDILSKKETYNPSELYTFVLKNKFNLECCNGSTT